MVLVVVTGLACVAVMLVCWSWLQEEVDWQCLAIVVLAIALVVLAGRAA